jgi:hypothetical protein
MEKWRATVNFPVKKIIFGRLEILNAKIGKDPGFCLTDQTGWNEMRFLK